MGYTHGIPYDVKPKEGIEKREEKG